MSEQEVWRKKLCDGGTTREGIHYSDTWLILEGNKEICECRDEADADAILRDHELAQEYVDKFLDKAQESWEEIGVQYERQLRQAAEARIDELEANRTTELKVVYERITELEAKLQQSETDVQRLAGVRERLEFTADALAITLQAAEAEVAALRELVRAAKDRLSRGKHKCPKCGHQADSHLTGYHCIAIRDLVYDLDCGCTNDFSLKATLEDSKWLSEWFARAEALLAEKAETPATSYEPQ